MVNNEEFCSLCKNKDFACKSCYLKEDNTPSNFYSKYAGIKNNINKPIIEPIILGVTEEEIQE